jgi:hypothetical protein
LKNLLNLLDIDNVGTCSDDHEEYNNCGTHCQRTCSDVNAPQKPCNLMCAIDCFCIDGYVRQSDQNSSCIKETECEIV